MISSFSNLGDAAANGRIHYQYVYKTATPTPGTAGFFVDMNQTSGVPKYNAFAGSSLTFTPLTGAGNAGIYPGSFTSGETKHLLRWQLVNTNTSANTTSPEHVYLNDYLGFYPLIDGDDVDVQFLDNTESLPRYTSGDGVRIVLIVQAPLVATASLSISYTNSDGVAGRTATFNVIPGVNIGVVASGSGTAGGAGQASPFWPLVDGDTGVRSVESVQFAAGAGGFLCLALVKPLAHLQTYEAGVPVEKCFGFQNQNLPTIVEGAYLNMLVERSGTGAGSIRSELIFVNS